LLKNQSLEQRQVKAEMQHPTPRIGPKKWRCAFAHIVFTAPESQLHSTSVHARANRDFHMWSVKSPPTIQNLISNGAYDGHQSKVVCAVDRHMSAMFIVGTTHVCNAQSVNTIEVLWKNSPEPSTMKIRSFCRVRRSIQSSPVCESIRFATIILN